VALENRENDLLLAGAKGRMAEGAPENPAGIEGRHGRRLCRGL
jgi:hypothetical protein